MVIRSDPSEREVQGLLGEGGKHNDWFQEVSDGARQWTLMNHRASGNNSGLQEDGSTCASLLRGRRSGKVFGLTSDRYFDDGTIRHPF